MKYSLFGIDGNSYCVMGYVARAMRECGKSKAEIDAYIADVKSRDYTDYTRLLAVSNSMVTALNEEIFCINTGCAYRNPCCAENKRECALKKRTEENRQ